ncbi:hypothetical protein ACA910_020905 [Epithemia clementina (nom. ined.)]
MKTAIRSKKLGATCILIACITTIVWNGLLVTRNENSGSRASRTTQSTKHSQRGRTGNSYSPFTYNKSLLEWPAGKAMEWEYPGQCDLRPYYVPSVCCFGGIHVFQKAGCHVPNRSAHLSKLQEERLETESQFANESPCHICDVAEYLIRYNWTLTMEGDSVTDQMVVGFRCALFRRGYRLTPMKTIDGGRNKSLWYKYGLDQLRFFRFIVNAESSSSRNSSNATAAPIFSGQLVYARAYRAMESHERAYVWSQSDIVVFDHGLHWAPDNLMTDFRKETADYLRTPRPPNLKLLAWRETTAQHFIDKPGGHYMQGISSDKACTAWPDVPPNIQTNPKGLWADLVEAANSTSLDRFSTGLNLFNMRKACELANLTLLNALDKDFVHIPLPNSSGVTNQKNELVYLPTRSYTANLHYLHPHGEKHDCTHFCNTAILWEPTWRGLKHAMDRTFQSVDPRKQNILRALGFADRLPFDVHFEQERQL